MNDPDSRIGTHDLINMVAGVRRGRAISEDVRKAVHSVREYRNTLVHAPRGPGTAQVSLSEARHCVSTYLCKLPSAWGWSGDAEGSSILREGQTGKLAACRAGPSRSRSIAVDHCAVSRSRTSETAGIIRSLTSPSESLASCWRSWRERPTASPPSLRAR